MLNYISTNKGKYLRVKELADEYDIDVSHLNIDIDELEISDVEMVSKDKAYKAYNKVNNPVLVEDSGFYIEDYPNTYNNYACEISLPVYFDLADEQVDEVIRVVKECVPDKTVL